MLSPGLDRLLREERRAARAWQVAVGKAFAGVCFLVLSAYLSWRIGREGLDRSLWFWLLFWFSLAGVVKTA